MNISQAHEISIISFLEKEGFRPCRVYGDNYWYRSPLREEKIASFKVNRDINRWYDYGMSEGGDIVELAKRLRGLQPYQPRWNTWREKTDALFVLQHLMQLPAKRSQAMNSQPSPCIL